MLLQGAIEGHGCIIEPRDRRFKFPYSTTAQRFSFSWRPKKNVPGGASCLQKRIFDGQTPRSPFLDCAKRNFLKMGRPEATAPGSVRNAFLKVKSLVALRHQSRLDAFPPIHHLSRENPSRLRNLFRFGAISSRVENAKFFPCIKFLDLRSLN